MHINLTCRQQSYFKVLGLISSFPDGKFFYSPFHYAQADSHVQYRTILTQALQFDLHIKYSKSVNKHVWHERWSIFNIIPGIVQGRYEREQKMGNQHYLFSRSYPAHSEGREHMELYKRLLQPHFLFNSLNNLYALSITRSDQTPQAIADLSQLLEKVVTCSRKDLIPLSDEIELIRAYIDLEKIWLGENAFNMDFEVRGDTAGVMIPPLTLYTLVENAFKHGIRKCGGTGWITIHLVVKADKILLKVRNPLEAVDETLQPDRHPQSGLGIEAVRKLLDGSYHRKYYLNARPIGNVFAVDLILGRLAA